MAVLEVFLDGLHLILRQVHLHVFLESVRQLLRTELFVFVSVIFLEKLTHIDLELRYLSAQRLYDILD